MVLGLVRLVRPLNVALFVVGVALGGLLAAGPAAFAPPALGRLALAALSGAAVGAAANAINDVYDLAIDRVNRPGRPLPSGQVSPAAARGLWAALTLLGVALGLAVSPTHGALAFATAALLWAYSARLKRTPGGGHVAVALVLALALVYGGLAVAPSIHAPLLGGATFAFLTTLAREIAKALEDQAGDDTDGARTLPLVWGPRRTAALALAVVALTVLALPAPALLGLDPWFLAYVGPAAVCLLAAAWALLAADARAAVRPGMAAWRAGGARASAWLKAAMGAGIAALAWARLG